MRLAPVCHIGFQALRDDIEKLSLGCFDTLSRRRKNEREHEVLVALGEIIGRWLQCPGDECRGNHQADDPRMAPPRRIRSAHHGRRDPVPPGNVRVTQIHIVQPGVGGRRYQRHGNQ